MKKTLYTIALLCISYAAAFAQLPNPGFEEWDSLSFVDNQRIYDPFNWSSSNSEMVSIGKSQPITMSTDAHSGNYALKITSMIDDGASQGALIVSGHGDEKFALTGRIKYFELYYKYMPSGVDSFRIYLSMYKNGQLYGQAYFMSGQTRTQYSNVRWELSYPDNVPAPDSAKFMIQASIFNDSEGSVLLVDDIGIGYQTPTGLDELNEKDPVSIYPNPVKEEITFLGCPPRQLQHIIRNSKGSVVKQGPLTSNTLKVSELEPGIYFIQLSDDEGWNQSLKFMKQ